MCTVERFSIIHPNGFRERSSRLRPCERGTQNIPCDNLIIEISPEVPGPTVSPPPPPRQVSPDIHVIEPRQRDRRGRPESTKRPRGFADNLRLLFNTPNLFASRKKETSKPKPPKRKFVVVRQGRGRQHHPKPEPARYHQPTPPRPPQNIAPQNRPPVVQVPVHHREPEDMYPRRGQRVRMRDLEYRDEQNSPPPIAPYRQHHRPRARTLSPTSPYEERKRAQREAEREHEQRQREIWRLDQEAERQRRYQAQRDAEDEGRRVQREAEEIEIRRQDRARRESEELERRRRDRARRESEELERRRRDRARREAEEQERRRRDRARREAEELERRRRDRARREAEELERRRRGRARREAEEQERIERRRAAGIPGGPRHQPAVHQHTGGRGSLDERGEQVLNDAIQAEAERNDPYRGWYWRPDTGGLRRRGTVAGGERWVNEHDRRRGGRRHWI